MKKCISAVLAIFLSIALTMSIAPFVFAAESSSRLYSTYASSMLFQQNQDIILAGTGSKGTQISAVLIDSGDTVLSSASVVSADGTFKVTLGKMPGSYKQYTIVMSANGAEFARLNDVVFGELWLASGQSNMELSLGLTQTGIKMKADGETGSEWLRFFKAPSMPEYNGSTSNGPVDPQHDIPGAKWLKGNENGIFDVSGVGYFFAVELQKKLNMPVGVLNSYLGGTSIYTWISRDEIDNNQAVKNDLTELGRYIPRNEWIESKAKFSIDMTVNYNNKIEPLKNFRPAGMIWYQGETDMYNGYGKYTRAMELLQISYSRLFSRSEGNPLPLIYSQIASYKYGSFALPQFNAELSEIQQLSPSTRATVTLYDVPLTYIAATHAIHPICKKPVGEKICFAALGLVYEQYSDFTAPTVVSSSIENDSIVVKFRNVGDGLGVCGSKLYGFAVCGADGVYVKADAIIVDSNTVSIKSESVKHPVSASYAFSETPCTANLAAFVNSEKTLMVSQFVTDKSKSTKYWMENSWMSCDFDSVWHTHSNELSGYYDTWQSENAELSISNEFTADGSGALFVRASKNAFSVNPLMRYNESKKKTAVFADMECDWSHYDSLTFKVKSAKNNSVKIDGFKFYIKQKIWFSAQSIVDGKVSKMIPGDGKWHTVRINLDKLYPFGKEYLPSFSREQLGNIYDMRFCFNSENSPAAIVLEDFNVTGNGADGAKSDLKADFGKAKEPVEYVICALINSVSWIYRLFK